VDNPQSWNPFALGAMFCGEGLFLKCFACFCCIAIVAACVFGAPFLNVAVAVCVWRRCCVDRGVLCDRVSGARVLSCAALACCCTCSLQALPKPLSSFIITVFVVLLVAPLCYCYCKYVVWQCRQASLGVRLCCVAHITLHIVLCCSFRYKFSRS
jgi:hypothetical protein